MYVVVHFLDEGTVSCIPKSWLITKADGSFQCYWPPGKGQERRIQNGELPDKKSWDKYEVRVIGTDYKDYGTARKKSIKAMDTSQVDTEEEEDPGPAKRKKRKTLHHGRESFSEDEEHVRAKPSGSSTPVVSPHCDILPTHRSRSPSPSPSCPTPGNEEEPSGFSTESSQSRTISTEDGEYNVLKRLASIEEKLDLLLGQKNTPEEDVLEILLPDGALQDLAEFEKIEEVMATDATKRKFMVTHPFTLVVKTYSELY